MALRFCGVNLSVMQLIISIDEQGIRTIRDSGCQQWRHGIADLPGNFDFGPGEPEGVGEGLDARGLAMGNRPVLRWVKIAALLRLVELGANCEGRPVPPEAAE